MTFFSKTSDTRSSHVTFTLDSPREVIVAAPHMARVLDDDPCVMVTQVVVLCSWETGYCIFTPGYPTAVLRGDQGEMVHVNHLTHIPEWLSEIIAAGTPDLTGDAS